MVTGTLAMLRAYGTKTSVVVLGVLMTVSVLVAGPAEAKTFTVNSTKDFSDIDPGDGVCDTIAVQLLNPCTLRGAIQEANALAGMDTIQFGIPGGGARTIEPNSQLPVVQQRVTIDGYTQPGATENSLAQGNNAVLRIELDGGSAPGALLPDGLLISASDSVVKGS
jgi:CSLREA domain-containing protein